MNIETIQQYYKLRGLGWPDQKSALLFYLSEVGELTEAYLAIQPVALTKEESILLEQFAALGLQADQIVSRKPGWVRNNDRLRKENIAAEAADCNMMLSVFMDTYNGQSPDDALLQKMESKLGHPLENQGDQSKA